MLLTAGKPLVVMLKLLFTPGTNAAVAALVKAGG